MANACPIALELSTLRPTYTLSGVLSNPFGLAGVPVVKLLTLNLHAIRSGVQVFGGLVSHFDTA